MGISFFKKYDLKMISIVILFILFGFIIFYFICLIVRYYENKVNLRIIKKQIIENFENNSNYINYGNAIEKDPLYLSIKNAANISYLKGQIDELYKMRDEIKELNTKAKENADYNNVMQKQMAEENEGLANSLMSTSNSTSNSSSISNPENNGNQEQNQESQNNVNMNSNMDENAS
jgi:hypothetical protein